MIVVYSCVIIGLAILMVTLWTERYINIVSSDWMFFENNKVGIQVF